ncbi:MAG: hypothetical protein FWB78_08330 [Treponema sp.]|nr:hypothetical protein [Treponema sp.]
MKQTTFTEQAARIVRRAYAFLFEARRAGLLALDDIIDHNKVNKGDVFEYGIQLVLHGGDSQLVNGILSYLIAREPDDDIRRLKEMQKDAVLCIEVVERSTAMVHSLVSRMSDDEFAEVRKALSDTGIFTWKHELKTAEQCSMAMGEDGWALEHVPEELKTAELCLAAVRESGRALMFVPREHRTAELCHIAVRENGRAFMSVPREHRTAKLCHMAVRHDVRAIAFVPVEHRTQKLCEMAVKNNGRALWLMPELPRNCALRRLSKTSLPLNMYRKNSKPRNCALWRLSKVTMPLWTYSRISGRRCSG